MNDFDFEKIKPAVEEISLNDIQKAQILNACKSCRRQKILLKPLLAAAAVFTVIMIAAASSRIFFVKSCNSADSAAAAPGEEFVVQKTEGSEMLCGDVFEDQKEADDFVTIPEQFAALVDSSEFQKWEDEFSPHDGTALAEFVKYFSISREDFDRANAEYALESGCEPFDADMIFSFDSEAINRCYSASSEE